MDAPANSYQFIAQFFVVLLNAMMLVPLVLSWLGRHKTYLALFCLAGFLEISRQIPNALLAFYPDAFFLVLLSLLLQFAATLVFLAGLFRMNGPISNREYAVLYLPGLVFLFVLGVLAISGLPDNQWQWIFYSLPMSFVSLALVWQAWRLRRGMTAGKIFLLFTALVLLLIRAYVPFLGESDLFFLLYYLENLLFPLLLAAVTVLELEGANDHISDMHERRKQSEQELQFIVDNALDVILVTDAVGLLRSWNKQAEAVFGYSHEQIVGKMHIDELFADANLNKHMDDYAEFTSRIEHLEGGVHDVHVRMRTVTGQHENHMVFVIQHGDTRNLAT